MSVFLLACQLALSAVLLAAAVGKMMQSQHFLAALRLSHVPGPLVSPTAVATPLVEACLSVALIVSTPQSLVMAMGTSGGLLGLFTAWMLRVYARGLRPKCGCFGSGSSKIGLGSIARNAALIVVSLSGAWLATRTQSLLPPPSVWTAATAVSGLACWGLVATARQVLPSLVLSPAQLSNVEAKIDTGQVVSGG